MHDIPIIRDDLGVLLWALFLVGCGALAWWLW
jgi:hypothetical protein